MKGKSIFEKKKKNSGTWRYLDRSLNPGSRAAVACCPRRRNPSGSVYPARPGQNLASRSRQPGNKEIIIKGTLHFKINLGLKERYTLILTLA